MFNLEAYQVVGFDRRELQATEEAEGLVLSFVHLWSVGVFSFREQMFALKRELHSCFRSHFMEKPAYMFPQLFVDVFSRESPKIVTLSMISSIVGIMSVKFTQKGRTLGLTFCR